MKKIILILTVFISVLFLPSCNNSEEQLTDFEVFTKCIYDSELVLAGYNEKDVISDNGLEIYVKTVDFKLTRAEVVSTSVSITEKKLSSSGTSTYDTDQSNYTTVDNKKTEIINGTAYETEYTVPTYFLTFVISQDFLEEGFEFTKDGNNFTLSAKIKDNEISAFFLNKSVTIIKNLTINIEVKDSYLKSFVANYVTSSGFSTTLTFTYSY